MRRYVATLEQCIARLVARQGAFKDMDTLYPSLRMAHCEHHYVFCLPRENAPALIVAIFHERMDLMTRLADRLGRDIGRDIGDRPRFQRFDPMFRRYLKG